MSTVPASTPEPTPDVPQTSPLLPQSQPSATVGLPERISKLFGSSGLFILAIGSGVVVLVLGFVLAASTDTQTRIIGNVLVALGGLLGSYFLATANTRAQVLEESKPRFRDICSQILSISGEIRDAVAAAREEQLDAQAAYVAIHAHANMLWQVERSIETLTGVQLDTEDMKEWVGDYIEVTQEISKKMRMAHVIEAAPPSQRNENMLAKLYQEMESLLNRQANIESRLTQLSRVGQRQLGDTLSSPATVECPNPACRNPSVEFQIGNSVGASAAPVCPICRTRFHAHRRADGSVFANPWYANSGVAARTVTVECPHCHMTLSFDVRPGDADVRVRYCLNEGCYYRLEIDPTSSRVVNSQPSTPQETSIFTNSAGKTVVYCNKDNQYSPVFYERRDGKVFGVCPTCGVLLMGRRARTGSQLVDGPLPQAGEFGSESTFTDASGRSDRTDGSTHGK